MLNLIKPPLIAVRPQEQIGRGESVRNSDHLRDLCAQRARDDRARSETGLLAVDEARVSPKLPIKLLAVDRSVALVPLAQQDTTPIGVLVRESAVLDALLALFEHVWATAIPLHVHGRATVAAGHRRFSATRSASSCLCCSPGSSDEAIAMHRGMSVRTVQRKVHALMELANVRTRMQLAWEAARRQWLEPVRPARTGTERGSSATTSSGRKKERGPAPQARGGPIVGGDSS